MPARPFHRASTVDKLDKQIREEINRLRIDSGFTLDQIIDHLQKMGGEAATITRSALHRHLKPLQDRVGDQIKELRVAAEAVRKTLDDGDDAKVGALNRELAHAILMRISTSTNTDGDSVEFSPQEGMFIAKALDHLASAEKKDTDRILTVRKETAKAVLKATDEELKSGGAAGLTKSTQGKIMKLLGIQG